MEVLNLKNEIGKIIKIDDVITVDFNGRLCEFELNSFELGYLRYLDSNLQKPVDLKIRQNKNKLDLKTQEENECSLRLEKRNDEINHFFEEYIVIPNDNVIVKFSDEYKFLAPSWEDMNSSLTYDGITYSNLETAFYAQKVKDRKKRLKYSKLNLTAARKKDKEQQPGSDWDINKFYIMYELVKIKFSNPILKDKLLKTYQKF